MPPDLVVDFYKYVNEFPDQAKTAAVELLVVDGEDHYALVNSNSNAWELTYEKIASVVFI